MHILVDDVDKMSPNYLVFSSVLNTFGYVAVLLSGYLIYRYVKNSKFSNHLLQWCLQICLLGQKVNKSGFDPPPSQTFEARSTQYNFLKAPLCFFGLLGSYLTWGYLQEKIMTQKYTNSVGEAQYFKDSQFLVFINRTFAVVLSGAYLLFTQQPRHTPPLYKYTFASLSNIMSAWCQYEALKFVGFPTQVLTKASKIIPVMIMGKIVSQKMYESYEYVTAVAISIGMVIFLSGDLDDKKSDATVTTVFGFLLLMGYILFDSFTSNWQGALFTQYRVSAVQMMCGVNAFSCLLLFVSLTVQGSMTRSLTFMTKFPAFVSDCLIISISSAAGQLFIFSTIRSFGPVVFTMFMSVRQVLSVLLSYYSYSHPVSAASIFGVVIIFTASFIRLYCDQRTKTMKKGTKSQHQAVSKTVLL